MAEQEQGQAVAAKRTKAPRRYSGVIQDDGNIELTFKDASETKRLIDFNLYPEVVQSGFKSNGMKQKFGDVISKAKTPEEAIVFFDKLDAQLMTGEWGTTRDGSGIGGISKRAKVLFACFQDNVKGAMKLTGLEELTLETVSEWYLAQPKEAQKQYYGSSQYLKKDAELKAAEADNAESSLF